MALGLLESYNRTRYVEELLDRTKDDPPSLAIHLHADYWILNNGSKFLYQNQMASLLDDIRAHRIPVDFLDLFDNARVPFYEGCMIVELLDYRVQQSKGGQQGEPDRTRVILHPNPETIYADICSLNQKYGGRWTDSDALEVEATLLLATAPPLCLDPNPHLTRIANHVLRASTPTVPMSLKRKATTSEPEEDESEKGRKAKIMAFMSPRPQGKLNRTYSLLDTFAKHKREKHISAKTQAENPPRHPNHYYLFGPPPRRPVPDIPTPAPLSTPVDNRRIETPKPAPTPQIVTASYPPVNHHFITQSAPAAIASPGMTPQVYANVHAATEAARAAQSVTAPPAASTEAPTPVQTTQSTSSAPEQNNFTATTTVPVTSSAIAALNPQQQQQFRMLQEVQASKTYAGNQHLFSQQALLQLQQHHHLNNQAAQGQVQAQGQGQGQPVQGTPTPTATAPTPVASAASPNTAGQSTTVKQEQSSMTSFQVAASQRPIAEPKLVATNAASSPRTTAAQAGVQPPLVHHPGEMQKIILTMRGGVYRGFQELTALQAQMNAAPNDMSLRQRFQKLYSEVAGLQEQTKSWNAQQEQFKEAQEQQLKGVPVAGRSPANTAPTASVAAAAAAANQAGRATPQTLAVPTSQGPSNVGTPSPSRASPMSVHVQPLQPNQAQAQAAHATLQQQQFQRTLTPVQAQHQHQHQHQQQAAQQVQAPSGQYTFAMPYNPAALRPGAPNANQQNHIINVAQANAARAAATPVAGGNGGLSAQRSPQQVQPQAAHPIQQQSNIQTPQLTQQLRTPQIQNQQLRTPQTQHQQLRTPQMQAQQLRTPQMQTQQLRTPQMQQAQLRTPQMQQAQLQTAQQAQVQQQQQQRQPTPMQTQSTAQVQNPQLQNAQYQQRLQLQHMQQLQLQQQQQQQQQQQSQPQPQVQQFQVQQQAQGGMTSQQFQHYQQQMAFYQAIQQQRQQQQAAGGQQHAQQIQASTQPSPQQMQQYVAWQQMAGRGGSVVSGGVPNLTAAQVQQVQQLQQQQQHARLNAMQQQRQMGPQATAMMAANLAKQQQQQQQQQR
ncbi:hypothetical protein FA15DRAFT_670690 [Coprinopsis marcescibilis]|uniref:Spt20-like SEP domain-containing protein n=1 Tax=Coprinopsis marcescibilis TaxID=230819 RepID=A0A5C3KRK1_COPMA|nr:hypothetical protein FA15DRAFT_670690 [Coprinopsis marcescibilis]